MAENKFVVIDSSFILSYLLPDENLPQVEEIFSKFEEGKIEFIANRLLPFEVFNGLCVALMRKRISKELVKKLGERFLKFYIGLIDVDYIAVSNLAIASHLTYYDASYYYMAKEKKLKLLTKDKKLQKLA